MPIRWEYKTCFLCSISLRPNCLEREGCLPRTRGKSLMLWMPCYCGYLEAYKNFLFWIRRQKPKVDGGQSKIHARRNVGASYEPYFIFLVCSLLLKVQYILVIQTQGFVVVFFWAVILRYIPTWLLLSKSSHLTELLNGKQFSAMFHRWEKVI